VTRFPALAGLSARLSPFLNPWVWCWAAVALAFGAALSWGPLENVPHVQDEVVYDFQARLLSQGKLWEAERLPRAVHHYEFVINADGRRFGVFPNGWPAVLALGKVLHADFLVSPLLLAACVVLGARLSHHVGGRRAAFLSAPLLALCPGLVVQSASRMSHTLCAALVLVVANVVFTTAPSRRSSLLAGTAMGWLLLTRPLDAVIVAVVFGVVIARRGVMRSYAPALAPVVAALILVGTQNALLTGDPLFFPQTLWFARNEPATLGEGTRYTAECNRLGFGRGHGCFSLYGVMDHSVRRGAEFSAINLQLVGRLWFGFWPLGLLALVPLARPALRGFTAIVLCLWLGLVLAYSGYWYHGACFGPRFYHSACALLVVCLALGLSELLSVLRAPALLGLLPLLAYLERFNQLLPELRGYWGVDGRLQGIERRWDRGPVLFLVAYGGGRGRVWHSLPNTAEGMLPYVATLRRGMWIERSTPLVEFAEYQPSLQDELVKQAGGRKVYLLVLHDSRREDYLVPLEDVPPPGLQVTSLTVPQRLPFYSEPLEKREPVQAYYAR
jgi:hypothetical protein